MSLDESERPVVLVVDDSAETLSLLTDILEGGGMTALAARSGQAAMTLLTRVTPDLILMDAVMPEMDGFEACRRIKQDKALAHIPLIFMTGLTDTENVVRGFRAGGNDYVTKPVIPDEILARILGHLSSARLAQSARVALDVSGTPLIAVDLNSAVLWMTPASLKLLGHSAETRDTTSAFWREQIEPLLRRIVEHRLGKTPIDIGKGQSLMGAYAGESRPGEHLIRLSAENAAGGDEILRRHFELTGREAEVLFWVAQGKSNRDVADILACSPRTINKHLEQVYAKLDVDNRTAAAMAAVKVLMEG